jgi:hypothetical protein
MPNVIQLVEQPTNDFSQHKSKILNELISEQVIHALGTPDDLLQVQVRKVWDDHYRVNVLVGPNAGAVRLLNSYFVETDSNGQIITATPKIVKLY